jgi:flagellar protein FliO/FliZ
MKIIIFYISLFSLVTVSLFATPTDDLNQELRKEMGAQDAKVQKAKDGSSTTEPALEPNPVRERYSVGTEEDGSLLWILVKITMVFTILAVIFYYALRFLSINRNERFPVKGLMRVLSSLPVSGGKEVQIIDVGGMLFVIGISEGGINLIKEIDSQETKEKIYQARDTAEPTHENFVDVLLKNFKGTETLQSIVGGLQKATPPSEDDVVEEIKSRQIERLDKMRKERQDILKKDVDNTEFSKYI